MCAESKAFIPRNGSCVLILNMHHKRPLLCVRTIAAPFLWHFGGVYMEVYSMFLLSPSFGSPAFRHYYCYSVDENTTAYE